jgi:hypothetical protein
VVVELVRQAAKVLVRRPGGLDRCGWRSRAVPGGRPLLMPHDSGGEIEPAVVPANPLDVVAQQVVTMAALDG